MNKDQCLLVCETCWVEDGRAGGREEEGKGLSAWDFGDAVERWTGVGRKLRGAWSMCCGEDVVLDAAPRGEGVTTSSGKLEDMKKD